jgi:hypothetical protein
MTNERKRGGWSNPASAENGRKATRGGRPPTSATIRNGDGLMLSHVSPDGTADLGHGRVIISAIGRSRLIVVCLPDGSEIRILQPK